LGEYRLRNQSSLFHLGHIRSTFSMTAPERDRIVQDPKILDGKAAIRGTRISVGLILDKMARGGTIESILASYPHLQREDIQSVLVHNAEFH
jgi:uncharacterized protein (DUF433 family)